MTRINLLPAEIIEKRKYERFYPYVFIAGAVLLAFVLVTWLTLEMFNNLRAEQLQQAEETVNGLNQKAETLAYLGEQQQALAERQQVAARALDARVDMGKLMEEVSLVLPEPLWIDELVLNQDAGVTMRGYTPDAADDAIDSGYKSIAAGLVRINELEDVEDVWLTDASSKIYTDFQDTTSGGEARTVGFEVSAKIVRSPEATKATVPAPPSTTSE